jgi:hypothetical protein
MSSAEMRRKIKKTVDTLRGTQLKAAAQLLRQLQEEQDATDELLNIPGFRESFRRGMRDIAAGRVTPVEKLRRKR